VSLDRGALDDLIGLKLRLAQLHFYAEYYAEFGPLGVTPAEYAILELVAVNPGVRQGVLAEALSIKRSNMTKVVRGLEGRRLLRRTAPPTDGRAFELTLTPSGETLRRELASGMRRNDRLAASALEDDEQAELLRLLSKLLSRRTEVDPATLEDLADG
jgi:DNA-binding MarR family transcriptional regulator